MCKILREILWKNVKGWEDGRLIRPTCSYHCKERVERRKGGREEISLDRGFLDHRTILSKLWQDHQGVFESHISQELAHLIIPDILNLGLVVAWEACDLSENSHGLQSAAAKALSQLYSLGIRVRDLEISFWGCHLTLIGITLAQKNHC